MNDLGSFGLDFSYYNRDVFIVLDCQNKKWLGLKSDRCELKVFSIDIDEINNFDNSNIASTICRFPSIATIEWDRIIDLALSMFINYKNNEVLINSDVFANFEYYEASPLSYFQDVFKKNGFSHKSSHEKNIFFNLLCKNNRQWLMPQTWNMSWIVKQMQIDI